MTSTTSLIAWNFQDSKTFLPSSASARSADISIGIRCLASGRYHHLRHRKTHRREAQRMMTDDDDGLYAVPRELAIITSAVPRNLFYFRIPRSPTFLDGRMDGRQPFFAIFFFFCSTVRSSKFVHSGIPRIIGVVVVDRKLLTYTVQ